MIHEVYNLAGERTYSVKGYMGRQMSKLLALLVVALALGVASCGNMNGDVDQLPPDHSISNCGPFSFGVPWTHYDHFLEWTPDGSHLIFDHASSGIWVVDAEGTQVRKVADANPGELFKYGIHADLSPDGSRIVYSSCEFSTEGTVRYSERENYNYEIVVINLDGTGQRRLTENHVLDHYPVWSPDGSRIAFLSIRRPPFYEHTLDLYTMAADGSDVRLVASTLRKVTLEAGVEFWYTPAEISIQRIQRGEEVEDSEEAWLGSIFFAPPVWSPDGERLAFIVGRTIPMDEEGTTSYRFVYSLFTVRAEGSEMTRISDTAVVAKYDRNSYTGPPILPSWSPDGEYLVFVMANEEGEPGGVYTVRFDGTELRKVAENASHVSWSPDGLELLLSMQHIVSPGGSDLRTIEFSGFLERWQHAAWSPDSTRIALYMTGIDYSKYIRSAPQLYTVARDGTDRRDLIRRDANGNLVPANPPQQDE